MVTVHAVPDSPEAGPIGQAVEETIAALGCPPSDAAVVALARTTAATLDSMQPGQRGMMLGQTAPLLLKLLQELEQRAAKRRSGARGGRPNGVSQLRAAHAATKAKRAKAG